MSSVLYDNNDNALRMNNSVFTTPTVLWTHINPPGFYGGYGWYIEGSASTSELICEGGIPLGVSITPYASSPVLFVFHDMSSDGMTIKLYTIDESKGITFNYSVNDHTYIAEMGDQIPYGATIKVAVTPALVPQILIPGSGALSTANRVYTIQPRFLHNFQPDIVADMIVGFDCSFPTPVSVLQSDSTHCLYANSNLLVDDSKKYLSEPFYYVTAPDRVRFSFGVPLIVDTFAEFVSAVTKQLFDSSIVPPDPNNVNYMLQVAVSEDTIE